MPERRLSELARVLSQPSGIVSSDFPLIERAASRMGISYDLWQKGLLYLMFGKRGDGLYACGGGGAVISICRQVGKTFTVGSAIFILCAGRAGLKVLWTAYRTRTSDETFQTMCGFARDRLMARHVDHIRRANGQQEIAFTNGSRIMFGAREQGFGRGFDAVDMEVFDEAQILTVKALNDMVPAMNVSPNPLLVFMGTPPQPGDPSEQFAAKRADGLRGADGMLYVEFSADRDADPDDHAQWAKANPSYPKRTSGKAIERLRQSLGGVDNFRREALGIWDDSTHALRCALAIVSLADDPTGTGMARPRELVLYEPGETLRIRLANGRYTVTGRTPNTLGHVPVHVLAHHQDLHRPFGRSRISREVMSLTDTAVRTMLRMEVSAEFYSWPQRVLLGADEPPADKDGNVLTGWQASISKMLAVSRNEDGQLPSIQQFEQMTMAPHTDMLRALAGRFSGATGVPMAQLGVLTDSGPSSADAIAAAETELVIEARNTCDAFGAQLRRAAQDMALLNGASPGDGALRHLKVNWRNPERPSQAAMADAVLKQVQAIPWLANSRVILEQLGYTDTDITRLLSDKRRAEATNALNGLLRSGANATGGTRTGGTAPGIAGGGSAPGAGGTGGTMEENRQPDVADQT